MLFKISKQAVYAQLQAIVSAGLVADIGQACLNLKLHLENMREEWFSGKQPQIAYHDPYCRAAYVFAHVPANANLCSDALSKVAAKWGFEPLDEFRVVAFGGGPGTELLAFARYLRNRRLDGGGQIDMHLSVVDFTTEWSEALTALAAAIKDYYRAEFGAKANWPTRFDLTSYTFNFLKTENYVNVPALFNAHMIVLNYVVSEVVTEWSALKAVLVEAYQRAPSGSIFLVVDRNESATLAKAGAPMAEFGGEVMGPVMTDSNMASEEQLSEVSDLIAAVGRKPRVTWDAFWVAIRKPEPLG